MTNWPSSGIEFNAVISNKDEMAVGVIVSEGGRADRQASAASGGATSLKVVATAFHASA
ncbi:hypothetical protein NOF55_10365 [Rhizobiaceae bacterium BDR2-2]|uniref:Uncharacterized protein n=1 Tax=Ectorhizobium quercum TaxID=2965071 RepID=A0AAE3MYR8_9HYPH|nr:hypothetical protein [Ectorhizobium quercum]MCX8997513.1 hypothetical protein [Ectorhizobium quercum]